MTEFPIQAEDGVPASRIPVWLAELAHRTYIDRHNQDLETLARRGGFGRAELVAMIRGTYTIEAIRTAQADIGGDR